MNIVSFFQTLLSDVREDLRPSHIQNLQSIQNLPKFYSILPVNYQFKQFHLNMLIQTSALKQVHSKRLIKVG